MADDTPRKWQSKGFIPFRLEVLTPVHIGSGTTLSPLEYVIRREGKTCTLHRIDLQSWLMEHASDESVQNIIAGGDISRIRRMLDEKVDASACSLSQSPVKDATLADELQKAFGGEQTGTSPRKDKTGDVAAALRNPLDQCLYIPGSSLKGAISTPLIDHLDKSPTLLKEALQREGSRGVQGRLTEMFGSISNHAMQALKVSDVPAPFSACAIFRSKEQSRTPGKKGTPKPPCEAVVPGCDGMWGRFMLDSAGTEPAITLPRGKKVTFPELVRLCNNFYRTRFREELDNFYALPHFREVRAALRDVEAVVTALKDDAMLLRVGHYCHVECVTVKEHLPATKKGKNGHPLPFGTTRTLADGRLPFGWILLHFCSMEEYEEGMRQAEEKRRSFLAVQEKRRQALRLAAEEKAAMAARVAREKEERRLAAERKAAEERQKQEELARRMAELSPEEARLLKLEAEPSEALSMEIFNEMKTWSPELQHRAALALQAYWSALGKWEGRQSKKQEAKIKAVKALL